MPNTQEIAAETFKTGRKLQKYEFHKLHRGGDYHFNAYSRAFNKLAKEAADQTKTELKSDPKSLVNNLFDQTAILKDEYLEQTRIWSIKEFARLQELVEKYTYTIPGNKDLYIRIDRKAFDSHKDYNSFFNRVNLAKRIFESGEAFFVEQQRKLAVSHYEDSIIKLAARIEKKGLNQNRLKIETARVGVNIETTFTDGEKTVRAFTIVASGEVQKPHYRYLIK
jgi:hypothetical protein